MQSDLASDQRTISRIKSIHIYFGYSSVAPVHHLKQEKLHCICSSHYESIAYVELV
jgi:hypothetical protein